MESQVEGFRGPSARGEPRGWRSEIWGTDPEVLVTGILAGPVLVILSHGGRGDVEGAAPHVHLAHDYFRFRN